MRMQFGPMTSTALTLAAACLVVAGCSSSTSGDGQTSSSAPPSSAPGQSSSAASSSASATSSSGVLFSIPVSQSDLPSGWTAKHHTSDPNDDAQQATLRRCVGVRSTRADQVQKIDSPDFDNGPAEISSSAAQFKSQADVATDTALLRSPKIDSCYQQLGRNQLRASLPAGAQIKQLMLHIIPGAGGGPSNVVATGTGTVVVTANGKTVTVYTNVAFIEGPRTEAQVTFTGVGGRIPAALQSAVIAKVAARAAG